MQAVTFPLLLAFLAAFLATLAVTPVVRGGARAIGMIAKPSGDRWHARPTALLGGIAVYMGFAVGAGLALWRLGSAGAAHPLSRGAVGVLLASSLMFLVGLADDKLKLKPSAKLIFQGLSAAAVISFGVIYPVTPWTLVNVLVTFFWFLALTNALNLLDNMDGVAVGVAGIAALFLAATLLWDGAIVLAAVCLALAGAAFGFLPYNFNRASIFMGDSGSLFIGALLAGLGAAYPSTVSASLVSVLFVPVLIVIIPILDTLLVTTARTLAGRPISVGGRDHTSHRLVAMGLSERQVALLLYAFAAAGGGTALALRGANRGVSFAAGGVFLVGLLTFAAYLGRLHTYAPSEIASRRVTLLVSDLLHKRRAFEVVLDLVLFAVAYQGAYLLRWDGAPPPTQALLFEQTLAIAVVAKSACFGLVGVYRGHWQHLTIVDVHRLALASVLGSLVSLAALTFAFPGGEFSRSIWIMDGILVALLVTGARASFRSLDLVRHSLRGEGAPALIYGADRGGEIAIREMMSNPDLALRPFGFIDDDARKRGRLVHGCPVVGGTADIARIVQRHGIQAIVLGTANASPDGISRLQATCTDLDLRFLQLRMELQEVRAPIIPAPPARGSLRVHAMDTAAHASRTETMEAM